MARRHQCFERFLEAGSIPFDNNASEQAVKNPVIEKKNWMFFGSPAGGQAAAGLYTLTATCRRLKIDPYAYLKDVFERIPLLMQHEAEPDMPTLLMPLLPDHWLASHPESQLKICTTETTTKSARRRSRRAQRRNALNHTRKNRQ